jgi:NADPH:quinone reductase
MQALVLQRYARDASALVVEERPVPRPGPGEVLVRIAASPINPSDLAFMEGRYGFVKPLPVVPGFEGSGRVVASGRGLVPWLRLGKRVVCAVQDQGDGCWAEYALVSAMNCLPLPDWIQDEPGASMLVNPFTCYALIQEARKSGATHVVESAAGGVLGRMLWRLGAREGIEMIGVVRRSEQAEELRKLGMRHVLASSSPDFDERLRGLCAELRVKLAFDAVGGATTARLAQALLPGGVVTVYGQLAPEPAQVDVRDLIFRGRIINGFWLTAWLKRQSVPATLLAWRRIQRLVRDEMKGEIRSRHSLSEAAAAIADYRDNMSGGKVLLLPARPGSAPSASSG